jgi:hypothetical protein
VGAEHREIIGMDVLVPMVALDFEWIPSEQSLAGGRHVAIQTVGCGNGVHVGRRGRENQPVPGGVVLKTTFAPMCERFGVRIRGVGSGCVCRRRDYRVLRRRVRGLAHVLGVVRRVRRTVHRTYEPNLVGGNPVCAFCPLDFGPIGPHPGPPRGEWFVRAPTGQGQSVNHYDEFFKFDLTEQEKNDLIQHLLGL